MKLFLQWLLCILVCFAVQSSLLPAIYYNETGPDILLLVVSSFAFLRGSRKGSCLGFGIGLFQDLAAGTFFGLNAFVKLIVGFGSGIFSSRVLQDNFLLAQAMAVLSTIISYLISLIIMLMLGYYFDVLAHISAHLVPTLCFNIMLAYPVHRLVHYLTDQSEKK